MHHLMQTISQINNSFCAVVFQNKKMQYSNKTFIHWWVMHLNATNLPYRGTKSSNRCLKMFRYTIQNQSMIKSNFSQSVHVNNKPQL